jgi:hypothetical protein
VPVRPALILAFVLTLAALPAAADQGQGPPPNHPGSRRDFLFGRPRGSIGVHGSFLLPRAGSDLFDFVTDQLTLDRGDFRAPGVGLVFGLVVSPRLEAVAGVEFNKSQTASEYRRLVDNNLQPINQETVLRHVAVTGSVKVALTPRGRRISRLAWIPSGVTPYVGGGAGAVRYEFLQRGDFVDFVDSSIFTDVFQSKGWAPSAHGFGGVDVQLYRLLFLTLEGRYTWASADLGRDFIGFDPIDLTGFGLSAGVNVLF